MFLFTVSFLITFLLTHLSGLSVHRRLIIRLAFVFTPPASAALAVKLTELGESFPQSPPPFPFARALPLALERRILVTLLVDERI